MMTYDAVMAELDNWRQVGMTKAEIVIALAEACMGWPYVWGGYGQKCTEANRRSYADRSTCPTAESEVIRKRCQRLRETSPKNTCNGCKWYPGGCTLFFDCRGFTRWLLARVGVSLQGAGATSQWNTAANWTAKGDIKDIPERLCCIFIRQGNTMSHTGLYIGNGWVIHCSGEVKKEKLSAGKWTNWAAPKGIEGVIPVPTPTMPTLRKGSRGEYVTLMQTKLIQLGYDLTPYGADGKFGNTTYNAVIKFQHDRGLTPDGIVGPKTWEALNEGKTETYTVTISGVSRTVAEGIVKTYGGSMTKEGD